MNYSIVSGRVCLNSIPPGMVIEHMFVELPSCLSTVVILQLPKITSWLRGSARLRVAAKE
jgi:hypothetical protein